MKDYARTRTPEAQGRRKVAAFAKRLHRRSVLLRNKATWGRPSPGRKKRARAIQEYMKARARQFFRLMAGPSALEWRGFRLEVSQ